PLNRLIGREREIKDIRDLVIGQNVREVTLTGPPGIGKTRLCLQVGREMLGVGASRSVATTSPFADGVFFIPLASLTDSNVVLDTVSRALGLQDTEYGQALPGLIEHLKDKELLLLLDNFEQVTRAG